MSELSELTLTIIRLGFLAVLWLFVVTTVSVMRSDLFGRRTTARPAARNTAGAVREPSSSKPAKPPRSRRGVPHTLVVTQGSLAGTSVRLGESAVTLGRSQESTIVLDDDYVSSRHARFYPRAGRWYVEDMGSTNGTYLDRTKVTSATPVQMGVPVRIGKTVVELRK